MNAPAQSQDDASRRKLRTCLIVASILYPVSLAVWFPVYFVVLMGGVALPLYILWPYPAVVVVVVIAGWVFYRKRRDRAAWWSIALPLIHILLFVVVMAILILGANLR